MIPLEVIVRNVAAGSIVRNYRSGKENRSIRR